MKPQTIAELLVDPDYDASIVCQNRKLTVFLPSRPGEPVIYRTGVQKEGYSVIVYLGSSEADAIAALIDE